MTYALNPREADRQFFTSLIEANVEALERLLADDFILIDVMSGSEITKPAFFEVIKSGQIEFESIEPAENRVRMRLRMGSS